MKRKGPDGDMTSNTEPGLSSSEPVEHFFERFQAPPDLNHLRFTDDWQPSEDLPGTVQTPSDIKDGPAVTVREWVKDAMDGLPLEEAQDDDQSFKDLLAQKTEALKERVITAKQWILGHPRVVLCFLLAFLTLLLVILLGVITHRSRAETGTATTGTNVETEVTEEDNSAERPQNGTLLYNYYGALSVTLTVENNTERDCYVMTWGEGVTAQELYIRSGSSATFAAPMGTYHVYIATGDSWQNADDLFGSNTLYYTRNESLFCAYKGDVTLTIPADFSGYTQYANGWIIGR